MDRRPRVCRHGPTLRPWPSWPTTWPRSTPLQRRLQLQRPDRRTNPDCWNASRWWTCGAVGRKLTKRLALQGSIPCRTCERRMCRPRAPRAGGRDGEDPRGAARDPMPRTARSATRSASESFPAGPSAAWSQTWPPLKDALSTFVANACAKLRAQDSHASIIQVFCRPTASARNCPSICPALQCP